MWLNQDEFLREVIQMWPITYMSNARFAAYYERRLIDAANGRLTQNNAAKRYQPAAKIIPVTDITKTDEFAFEVVSTTSDRSIKYTVDMNLSVCTCHVGMTGAPCHVNISGHVHTTSELAQQTSLSPTIRRWKPNDANGNWRHGHSCPLVYATDMTASTVTLTHDTNMTASTATQTHDTDMTDNAAAFT